MVIYKLIMSVAWWFNVVTNIYVYSICLNLRKLLADLSLDILLPNTNVGWSCIAFSKQIVQTFWSHSGNIGKFIMTKPIIIYTETEDWPKRLTLYKKNTLDNIR